MIEGRFAALDVSDIRKETDSTTEDKRLQDLPPNAAGIIRLSKEDLDSIRGFDQEKPAPDDIQCFNIPSENQSSDEPPLLGEWLRTIHAADRLAGDLWYEEPDGESRTGRYAGRNIISRDTRINQGVYVGAGKREAIVVDDKKSTVLRGIYQSVLSELSSKVNLSNTIEISNVIYTIAFDRLGGSDTQRIQQKISEIHAVAEQAVRVAGYNVQDVKVSLDSFIKARAGVCRHRALLVGYIIEKLINDQIIQGKVSIDRNTIRWRGGHAWVRFTDSQGNIAIIDPSLQFVGFLKDASPAVWDYRRPEDIKRKNDRGK